MVLGLVQKSLSPLPFTRDVQGLVKRKEEKKNHLDQLDGKHLLTLVCDMRPEHMGADPGGSTSCTTRILLEIMQELRNGHTKDIDND